MECTRVSFEAYVMLTSWIYATFPNGQFPSKYPLYFCIHCTKCIGKISILQTLPRFTASFRSFHIGKVLLSLAEFRGSKDILWGSFAFFGGNFHDAGTRQKVTLAYSQLPSIHLQPNGSTFHTQNTVDAWFDTPESIVSVICMKRAEALFSKAYES